jgi:protein subunit release factor B
VSLESETDVEFFTAGGPGGQHRNKTQSAVRLYHRPSGITVTATERRSQADNRRVAFERLRARLEKLAERKRPRVATRPTRAAKRRRLDEKARHAQKKRERRHFDD